MHRLLYSYMIWLDWDQWRSLCVSSIGLLAYLFVFIWFESESIQPLGCQNITKEHSWKLWTQKTIFSMFTILFWKQVLYYLKILKKTNSIVWKLWRLHFYLEGSRVSVFSYLYSPLLQSLHQHIMGHSLYFSSTPDK